MKNDYTYNRAPGSLAADITPFCKHLNLPYGIVSDSSFMVKKSYE